MGREPSPSATFAELKSRTAVVVLRKGLTLEGRVIDSEGNPSRKPRCLCPDRLDLRHARPTKRADLNSTMFRLVETSW